MDNFKLLTLIILIINMTEGLILKYNLPASLQIWIVATKNQITENIALQQNNITSYYS